VKVITGLRSNKLDEFIRVTVLHSRSNTARHISTQSDEAIDTCISVGLKELTQFIFV